MNASPWRRLLFSLGIPDTKSYLAGLFGRAPDRDLAQGVLAATKRGAAFVFGGWEGGVDDKTWGDLNMDAVYARIDQTQSQAGEQALYAMLRRTAIGAADRTQRGARIDWAARDAEGREAFKRRLFRVGCPRNADLPGLYANCAFDPSKYRLHICLALAPLLMIALSILGVPFAPLLLTLSFLANIFVAGTEQRRNAGYADTMGYLVCALGVARAIRDAKEPSMRDLADRLEEALPRLRALDNGFLQMHAAISNANFTDAFTIIIGFLFLLESILFQRMLRVLARERTALLAMLRAVGEVDACISVASFRKSLPTYCVPDLRDRPEPLLRVEDAVHPLLARGVPNSLDATRSVLLTGSNATGKSTFLRTIAVNAILAQTILTCTAASWTSSVFRIETSMAAQDDLAGGQSLFVSEMSGLKRMIDHIEPERPGLLIVDEVLRGTNTHERIAASGALLSYFAAQNCLCLAATHDLELTDILASTYDNRHFEETATPEGMTFDYLLRDGPTRTRNALALLRLSGYDERIVDEADRSLDAFRETGAWPSL